jgi:Protein of unknown function (DUF3306)
MSRAHVLTTNHKANLVLGSAHLITLCAAWFLVTSAMASSASEMKAPASAVAALPSLDSIDAQTDVSVFLRSGVPARLQVAALRRAWSADPAIRDFKGLQESDWDFNNPESIPGFGELGPEIDVKQMVAELLTESPPKAVRPARLFRAIFGFASRP